jgi:hypothetical protein
MCTHACTERLVKTSYGIISRKSNSGQIVDALENDLNGNNQPVTQECQSTLVTSWSANQETVSESQSQTVM